MNETKKGFIQLHLSVLLAGFTGLFGRLITLNEVDIVWYRMLFTSCILLVFTGLPRVGWRKFLQLCGCGALLGLHWMLFYGSIKASNVSIGVICFSLIGFFTAILEPLLFKRRFSKLEILLSLITVAGVLCIFSLDARYRYGIMIGVLSSAVCAVYAICNKKASVGVRSRTVLMYQMSGGIIIVSAIIPVYLWFFPSEQNVIVIPEGSNLWFMLCHALFCTVGMYLLQIQALKRLSAFTVNLTYNLEPCYTIILAFLVFGEGREINFSFYMGIALILLSVLLQTVKAWRPTPKKPQLDYYDMGTGVVAFSSTRHGGCSKGNYTSFNINRYCGDNEEDIRMNREALCKLLGIHDDHLVMPHQVHQTKVAKIDEAWMALDAAERQEAVEGCDALMTNLKGVCIGVSTADCIPVLLYDEEHHAVCAIHAGWRGTVKRIVEKAVEAMTAAYGTQPQHLVAQIGPGIHLDNFEVGDEVYDAFANEGFPMEQISKKFPPTDSGSKCFTLHSSPLTSKWHIDLPECNRLQLLACGVKAQDIKVSPVCTYQQAADYFSARRLGINSGRIFTGCMYR